MYPTVRYLHISSKKDAVREMKRVGVDPQGIRLMSPKLTHFNLKVYGLTPPQANIIKQDMLSLGGEAATSRDVITHKTDSTDIIISGTEKQLSHIVEKLKDQHFGLKEVSKGLESALDNLSRERVIWRWRDRKQVLGDRTLLMGVLNVTPDSFSDGGEFCDQHEAVKHALLMAEEGADILDIGGESTRPGARPVETEEELDRVIPVIKAIVKETDLPVSVDTTKARVAEEALKAGAEIINDISAMRFDPDMVKVVSCYKAAVILMHMRGRPETMQKDVGYDDVISEIYQYLLERISFAVGNGIEPERIAIDPGIGFGKGVEDNLRIIKDTDSFKTLGRPIVLGPSRKSFIGKVLGQGVKERVEGTAAAAAAGVLNGANILRVHDVKEMRKVVDMADAIRSA